MSTKANSKIDTEKLRDIVRDEVTRQLKQSQLHQLQESLRPYARKAGITSEADAKNLAREVRSEAEKS
jgi:hypothetical protein